VHSKTVNSKVSSGLIISQHKAHRYAKFRRCFGKIPVGWMVSSGLATTGKCSLLLVTLTPPTEEIAQTMCCSHSLSTTTKDLWGSALPQVGGNVHNTGHSSG
jgi:hypothetical protein